jgi:replicative DNA helicase
MSEKKYEFIDVIATRYLEKINDGKSVAGVSTGFKDFDLKTGGLQRGELIFVGSRPAMGKTAFALSIARNLTIRRNSHVLFFSLEMSKERIAARVLASEAKVNCSKVVSGQLSNRERNCLDMTCEAIKGSKLIIDDTPGMTIGEICGRSAELKKEHNIEMVIIDYFQLISTEGRIGSLQQEMSDMAVRLKKLAKELDIPVVVLAQISRAVEVRDDHRPLLSDLRPSGAMEQYADMVLFLYRDKYYNKDSRYDDIAELIVAKQRNGSCGTYILNGIPDLWNLQIMTGIFLLKCSLLKR